MVREQRLNNILYSLFISILDRKELTHRLVNDRHYYYIFTNDVCRVGSVGIESGLLLEHIGRTNSGGFRNSERGFSPKSFGLPCPLSVT